MLDEIDFSRLQKLRLDVDLTTVEDISSYGTIYPYDKTYDRVNTKNDKPLQVVDRVRYNTSTSDDPIIGELAAAEGESRAKVFTTDSILALLMCAPRSVNSWDIVLERRGDQLFLDKREGGPTDFITVNENATDAPIDSDDPTNINSPASLSLEATYINQNFSSQVVDESGRKLTPNPNPFYNPDEETEPLASCLYRYRKFDLSISEDEAFDLVVRTEVDAYQGKKDDRSWLTVKALNEFDPRAQGSGKAPEWRKQLDTQRGAVVATEMKNNSVKLARWAVQSVLAGADIMKMGYVCFARSCTIAHLTFQASSPAPHLVKLNATPSSVLNHTSQKILRFR